MTCDALRRPLVIVAADRIDRHGHAAHAVLHGYVRAASECAGVMTLGLPAEAGAFDADSLIDSIDGVLLTGSPSNVSPACYGAPAAPDEMLLDLARDAAVLPLVRRVVAAGVPILGVCRGFQEMNVAFGGTLDPAVHTRSGRLDHREGDHARPIERWYDDSHDIDIAPGGVLAGLVGEQRVPVNSLHHQGIDRLGQGLRVEATAPDGLVEAFSVACAPAFALAVQFHPEMRIHDCPLAQAIFTAFGTACRKRLLHRLRAVEPAAALA
ncbi:gamma-glutamyl-gamma-aminobutyrate hydrolase family protein [Bradyrhizobium jicamae]|uniref:Gamma-glutamyl-gamma-aminobutyrate hydrolase family protein n=1 Tax=Bradyrhizobium jicamae TaxID=280332 RepID=A0ABS5FTW6_9BRAD|nr:gamma-glutamyl-gamma-aminobutyrate hydrolase family protein [Bradyrhizobium jicamae]MBR0933944.1 gamma-glutamyl-gamma-aminobutyrate hydrolase family protein [Bradyrhizobium jicamae]